MGKEKAKEKTKTGSIHMRILVVGNRIPWPLYDGGALATYRLLKGLSSLGHEITFFTYNTKKHFQTKEEITKAFGFCEVITHELDSTPNKLVALRQFLKADSYFLSRYESEEASNQLKKLIENQQYDLVQIEGLYSWPLLNPLFDWLKLKLELPVVYRAHNIESQIWKRVLNSEQNRFKKLFLRIQVKKLEREELRLLKLVDATIAISTIDEKCFQAHAPNPIHVFLPTVEQPMLSIKQIQPNSIFHIGSMEWEANVQGVQWFLSKVWPLLIEKNPDLRFHVAGKGIEKHKHLFFQYGVVYHGEVSNAIDFMKNYGVGIVPIHAGSGIRMKLIESMAWGIPSVSTGIGVQGLPLDNDSPEVLIADEAGDFAEALSSLFNDWPSAIRLGKRAHQYIQANHHEHKNLQELDGFLKKISLAKY